MLTRPHPVRAGVALTSGCSFSIWHTVRTRQTWTWPELPVGTCENQQVAVEYGGGVEYLVHQGPAPGRGVELTCPPDSRDSRNMSRHPCKNVYCGIIYKTKY